MTDKPPGQEYIVTEYDLCDIQRTTIEIPERIKLNQKIRSRRYSPAPEQRKDLITANNQKSLIKIINQNRKEERENFADEAIRLLEKEIYSDETRSPYVPWVDIDRIIKSLRGEGK